MSELNTNKAATVTIMGQEYCISGGNERYLQMLAQYVHKLIDNLSREQKVYSPGRLAILACLNITDELFQLKEKNKTMAENSLQTVTTLIEKIDSNLKNNSSPKENVLFDKEPLEIAV